MSTSGSDTKTLHSNHKDETDMTELTPTTHGSGRFLITLLTQPPFYKEDEILDLRDAVQNGGDPRIVATAEPAVNAISLLYKTRAGECADLLTDNGLQRIDAGIGDSLDGPTVCEVLMALNATGHQIFDFDALAAAGVDLDHIMHFEYGAMTGLQEVVVGIKPDLEQMLGFRMRDYIYCAHGGRADAAISMHASKEAMEKLWTEKRDAAKAAEASAKAAYDADAANADLRETWEKATACLVKFTRPKAATPVKTWGTYEDIANKVLGNDSLVAIECDGGVPEPEKLDKACDDPNIVFLLFCNPNNPSGRRVTGNMMVDLAFKIFEHKLMVHEDDIYSSKNFVGQHRSLFWAAAVLQGNPATQDVAKWTACHTTMSVGWSKHGCSGLRFYIMIVPYLPLRKRCVGYMAALYGPANSLSQRIVFSMVKNGGHIRSWHRINAKRKALCDAMVYLDEQLAPWGITVDWSGVEGGFYTWIRFGGILGLNYQNRNGRTKTLNDGIQLGKFLIERAGLVISPDKAALTIDPEGARISFGTMTPASIEAMGRQVAAAFIELMKENGHTRNPPETAE